MICGGDALLALAHKKNFPVIRQVTNVSTFVLVIYCWLYTVISHFNSTSKHRGKYKAEMELTQIITISIIFFWCCATLCITIKAESLSMTLNYRMGPHEMLHKDTLLEEHSLLTDP